MTNISLSYLLKTKVPALNEEFIWCVLTESVDTIQNSDFIDRSQLFLMTPSNSFISQFGKIIFIPMSEYSKVYCPSNIQNLEQNWPNLSYKTKLQIILYSLGKMLKLFFFQIDVENPIKSKDLLTTINQLTELNNDSLIKLSNIQLACSSNTKDILIKDRLSKVYQASLLAPNKMRSLSTSSLDVIIPEKTYTRNNSVDSQNIYENLKNLRQNYHCNETSSLSSNTSENSRNPCSLSNQKNGHIYLSRMDNYVKPNIPAAMERLKAQRKLSKANGPVKSPGIQVDGFKTFSNSEKEDQRNSLSLQNLSFTETANIERLNGERRFLGPEFVIRQNETFNVSCNTQRRNSFFRRADIGRNLTYDVQVNLLNGVSLFVRNLSKQSIFSHIINAIHCGYPDLEFVNYGLCFKLDNEYFFLKEDINIQKVAEYVIRKTNISKHLNENKKTLQLYYRIKFYPTQEMINEMNSFNHKLLYLQLRQDLLYMNNLPINVSESLTLAGMAVQAEYGYNVNNLVEDLEFFSVEFYFNKFFRQFLEIKDDEKQFLKSLQEPWNEIHWEKCEYLFVEKVCQHKFYGIHWYKVEKNEFGIADAIGKNTYLAVGRDSIQWLDTSRSDKEIQIHKRFCYKWRQIDSISIKNKKLLIKPKMQLKIEGMNSPSAFVCYIGSKTKAEHIIRLCNEHHLLASQNEDSEHNYSSYQSLIGSHRRLSTVDYPSSLTRTSFSFEDDDEETCDLGSDDEMRQSSIIPSEKSNLSKAKKLIMRSMNDLSHSKLKYANNENGDEFGSFDSEDSPNTFRESLKKSRSKSPQNDANFTEQLSEVIINRDILSNENLGIGIIKIQNEKDEGMFIKRILKDSPVDRCGRLKVGDEIVYINDWFVSNLTQLEIGNIIKNSGKSIKFLIRKHLYFNNYKKSKSIQKAASFTQTENKNSTTNISSVENTRQKYNIITIPTLQQILISNKTFSCFERYTFNRIFPTMKLSTQKGNNRLLKNKFEEIISKEICILKSKKSLYQENHLRELIQSNLNEYNEEIDNSSLKTFGIDIKVDEFFFDGIEDSEIKDLSFFIVSIKHQVDLSAWKFIIENSCKLLILFVNFHQNGVSILQQINNVLNDKFSNDGISVSLVEVHEFSSSTKFLRLSVNVRTTGTSHISNRRIFVIAFNRWNEEAKDFTTVEHNLQTINVACSLNESLSNSKIIILCGEEIFSKIGMFITLYSFVYFGIQKKLPILSEKKSQSIFYMISNQIGDQISELVLNENQYKMCISILNHLMWSTNRANSCSDTSDIN